MRRTTIGMLVCVMAVGLCSLTPDPAAGADPWQRPVAGRVERAFAAPRTRYGPGHLGVDFAAEPGTAVHAAAAGTVVFAGSVANARHVVVRHAGGLRTSYSFLATIRVHPGQTVARGAVLGTTGGHGVNHTGRELHFGLRIADEFVDPMRLFPPTPAAVRVHLAAVDRAPGPGSRPAAERKALVAGIGHGATPVVARVIDDAHELRPGAVPICVRLVALHRPEASIGPFRPG